MDSSGKANFEDTKKFTVPSNLTSILKQFTKAAIRAQPNDVISWSVEFDTVGQFRYSLLDVWALANKCNEACRKSNITGSFKNDGIAEFCDGSLVAKDSLDICKLNAIGLKA
ncbi:Ropporin-1 [Nymphon striatum]|nr:Ropporin-1 [Nymphon striatum]